MSQLIHMDTEIVSKLASLLKQYSEIVEDKTGSIKSLQSSTSWEGGSRDDYFNQVDALLIRFSDINLEVSNLNILLQREIDQWINADQQGSEEISSVKTIAVGISTAISTSFSGFWNSITRPVLEKKFSNWWEDLSYDDKLSYLKEEQLRIAEALGIDPIPLEIIDIEDSIGDSQGFYRAEDGIMYLDVDNFNADDPWDIVETLAHEMRHRKQHEAIDHYITTGNPPEEIELSTVQEWQNNFENYITPAEDFEDYRAQAIEVDARSYGAEYVDVVFKNKPWND